jgi:pyrimidine-nucleoside phosphorylase
MKLFIPELIRRKRDGEPLDPEEIDGIIQGYTSGDIPDYQMAALAMAVFFSGMNDTELFALTRAMIESGQALDLSGIPGIKVDKHSTGGVGDKISLPLASAVAALGVPVPMISGRGLGHTGGTLDKLESIPGFSVDQSMKQAAALLERHGLFLIGQTGELAPADRKLYALRDVTGTVESIPLIASSIMSKKLAEGIDALVLDVKVGRGAFMKERESARELARTMVSIGRASGKAVRALLTDMSAPLGYAVGNALEVRESIDLMRGEGPRVTTELTLELGAEMLILGERAGSVDEGRELIREALEDGSALSKFQEIVEAEGGEPGVCDDPDRLPTAREQVVIPAVQGGVIAAIDPMRVAMAALEVGAGRRVKEDAVDPATGVVLLVEIGDEVEEGEPVAVLHHNGRGDDAARGWLLGAFEISKAEPKRLPLIIERIS